MTFLGFDKKDWIYRNSIVDTDKERIQCLSNALFVDPDDGFVWHLLGDKYGDSNEDKANYCWSKAAKSYEKRLEKLKEDAIKYHKDSSHLLFMDVESPNIKEFVTTIYYNLGSVYSNLEKNSLAVEAYKQSYKIDKENYDALYFLGVELRTCKKYELAKKAFEKHIEKTGDYHSHYMIGMILSDQNQISQSLRHFWDCIVNAGKDAESCFFTHLSYAMLGNYKGAKHYLVKAQKLEPENPKRCLDLIEFLEEYGKNENTMKYYRILEKIHKKRKSEEIKS